MSFTHIGTDQVTEPTGVAASITRTVSAGTTNDLRIVATIIFANTTNSVASLSGGGVTTWTRAVGPYVDTNTGNTYDIWYGSITSAGTTLTINFNASFSFDIWVCQSDFRSSNAGALSWIVEAASGISSASTTSTLFPNLSSVNAGELYVGFQYDVQVGSNGTTSGFVYTLDTGFINSPRCYNLNLAAATAYQPNASQAPTGAYAAVAAIIDDGVGQVASVFTQNTVRPANRRVGPMALRKRKVHYPVTPTPPGPTNNGNFFPFFPG